MSGPKSVVTECQPLAAMLTASGLLAAETMRAAYAEAARMRERHLVDSAAALQADRAAGRQALQALNEQATQAEARFDQLLELARDVGVDEQTRATRPARPANPDFDELSAYLRALDTLTDSLRTILLTETARLAGQHRSSEDADFDAAIAASTPQDAVARLLGRIAHLGAPPPHIAAVAAELEQLLPGERATLLTTELRARIQAHVEAVQQRQVQEACAIVVQQSLADLGYQVEEIGSTLFVEGGVVHFRRQGWGDYMVRMRVDAKGRGANFNVLRAVRAGDNERSVLDHLAEDRWCAEFPALLKALEARGVKMTVTRHLEAGELPVQLVDAAKLPSFADDERHVPHTQPRTRELP